MANTNCTRNSWIAAAIIGLLVWLMTAGVGNLRWFEGLFLGVVAFGLMGAFLVWALCRGNAAAQGWDSGLDAAKPAAAAGALAAGAATLAARASDAVQSGIAKTTEAGRKAADWVEEKAEAVEDRLEEATDSVLGDEDGEDHGDTDRDSQSAAVKLEARADAASVSAQPAAMSGGAVGLMSSAPAAPADAKPAKAVKSKTEKKPKADKAAKPAKEKTSKKPKAAKAEKADKPAKASKATKSDKGDSSAKAGKVSKADKTTTAKADKAAKAKTAKPKKTKPTVSAAPDDLKQIRGVGPKYEKLLHDHGVTRFEQIAAWTDADIDRFAEILGRLGGRIRGDNWLQQAATLAAGGQTEFSKRVEKGGVY